MDLAHIQMSLEDLLQELRGHAKNVVEMLFFELLEQDFKINLLPLIQLATHRSSVVLLRQWHTLSDNWLEISLSLFGQPLQYFVDQISRKG